MFASARTLARSYFTSAGRAAARNLLWLSLFSLTGQGCALGVVLLLTAGLGRPEFGVVASALAFQAYLLKLGCAGVKPIIVRDGARRPDDLDTTFTSHHVIVATASGLVGVLTIAGIWLSGWGQVDERVLLSLLAAGNIAACLNIRPLFDAQHQQPKAACMTFASELIALLLAGGLYRWGRLTLPLIGSLFALKWLIACVGQHAVYHWRVRRIHWRFSRIDAMSVLASSWPIMLTLLITAIPMTCGVFLVRWMVDEDETAMLGLAQQVAMAYIMLLGLCSRILEPHIAGPYGLRPAFVQKLSLFVAAMSTVLLLAALAGAGLLLRFVINRQFESALAPICLMLLAAVIVNVGRIGAMYLVVMHRETSVFRANVGAAILFAVLALCLIPSLGAVGSGLASVLAVSVGTGLIVWQARSCLAEVNHENRGSLGDPGLGSSRK